MYQLYKLGNFYNKLYVSIGALMRVVDTSVHAVESFDSNLAYSKLFSLR